MEYEGGWFKVWRKLFKNPVFNSKDHCLFKTFMYCLYRANHKENDVLIDGQVYKLMPGEFITGRLEASKDLHFKSVMWDRKLVILEKLGILNRQANNRFSKISIINWHIYQGSFNNDEQVSEQLMNNSRTTDEQLMNTDKNDKNDKNVKNDKKKESYPQDFLLFYNLYPNRKEKNYTFKIWKKLKGKMPPIEVILEAIEKQKKWRENAGGEFRPEWKHSATWLNKGCWEDEVELPKPDDQYSHLEIARADKKDYKGDKNGND